MTVIDFNNAARQGEQQPGYIDADTLRQRLNADVAGFVQWLFSGRAILGKHEARIGDKYGEAGESLAIQLHGTDAGLWYDHATGEGGDLISLYQAYMGYDRGRNFQLALKEIASEYFGDRVEVSRPSWQPSAAQRIETKKAKLGDKPKAENLELGAPVENYPYHDRAGKILAVVRRYEPGGTDEHGKPKKTFRASPCFPNPRPLYRVPQIIQSTHVVLCEGERKADALASLGIEATTAMGGSNTRIGDVDWQPLAGKIVTLWPDKDKAGEDYMHRVAPILTGLGCKVGIVTPPADKPAKWDAYDCVSEGGDAAGLINNAQPLTTAQPAGRFRFLDLDDIEGLSPPDWLIENVITAGGLSVLWGKSGDMKSFVALDMALCVAAGTGWHGIKTKSGLAIYVAAEGSYGLARRAVGWRRTRGKDLPKPQFKIVPHTISLISSDLDQLIQQIESLKTKPTMIVIDTLARTFGAGDENKQADMNAYVSAADRLREATGSHVMIVHHTGVHADKRERGSNVLRGAADTMIKVQRTGERLAIINQAPEGKQKDAEEFKTIRLRAVKTTFQTGETEQSTLILNLDEDQSEPEKATPEGEAKPSKNQSIVLALLAEAGRPMKFSTIQASTNLNRGTLSKVLSALAERDLIGSVEGKDGHTQWEIR